MKRAVWLLAAAWVLAGAMAWAQEKPKDEKFVVAVLNFETTSKEIGPYGEAIPDLLTVFLTGDNNLQLVERAKVKHIFEELALGATGVVDDAAKAKIGHMTGAKFIITGRAMIVGKQLYVTAKIMNTETSKVGAKMAKGATEGKLDDIVQDLAAKISEYMAESAKAMQPKVMTEQEVVALLQKGLQGKAMPKFAVTIPERHVNRPVVDPAAETEVAFLLRACGATVLNTKDDTLSDWAREMMKEGGKDAPKGLQEADIAIVGEGFSEYAGTTEKLISCKARVEMKAVSIKTGRVLAVGRATATAVDLAEAIAAKSALQKAASDIALKLIPEAVDAFASKTPPAAETRPAPK